MSSKIFWASSGLVPSGLGPMFRRRHLFLLTISTNSSISDSGVRKVSPLMYPNDFTLIEVSVCHSRCLAASSWPRSISRTAVRSG